MERWVKLGEKMGLQSKELQSFVVEQQSIYQKRDIEKENSECWSWRMKKPHTSVS